MNLSGRLSHNIKLPGNVRYIGILSRFTDADKNITDNNLKFQHNSVILSGPEPQREILKQKLITLLKDKEPITIMFEGNPKNDREHSNFGNIAFYNHLPSAPMREMIKSSDLIITRAGYTTLMELVSLNLTALIIPTPGQTEQEYLAEYLSEKGWFITIPQNEVKDGMLITPGKAVCHDEINLQSSILLNEALKELLEKQHKKS
jgi:UDP:flavonoid glycosyltransferase YjiC (YdhE family)